MRPGRAMNVAALPQAPRVRFENVRVRHLDDGTSILFNSAENRQTSRCPRLVGRVAELVQGGRDLEGAMEGLLLTRAQQVRVREIFEFVAGDEARPPASTDLGEAFSRLVLCPTADCNLRCEYCYSMAGEASRNRMSWTMARGAIDYYADHSVERSDLPIVFHGGGEPMTNHEVVRQAVEYVQRLADERGRRPFFRISTNGVYPAERARWVARTFGHVSLGLDGPPDVHDRQRPAHGGGGTYDAVSRTLRILQESGALQLVNTVITPGSVERMVEIVQHFHDLGIKKVRLQPMAHCGRCGTTDVERLDPDRYIENLRLARATARSLGIQIASFCEQTTYHTNHYCGGCGLNLVVSWDGRIGSCHEALDPSYAPAAELLFGRVDDATGAVEVDWGRIRALRGRTYDLFDECRTCAYRTNCAGGCLIRAARSNGTVMSIDTEWCQLVMRARTEVLTERADELAGGPA